ncbi:N-acetylglucosamine kinase [soil metagenome]
MKTFLGVDGGNSKTLALVAREDGQILGWGRGGSGDIYGSEAGAVEAVNAAVHGALNMAGLEVGSLHSSCFSLVGADWPEDFTFWQRETSARGYGKRNLIVNDALGALRAGTPREGVVVACGTGAAVGAKGLDGRVWHSSFWQEQLGGCALGEAALRAVYRSELGIDPPTDLTSRVLEHFHVPTVETLLHRQTGRGQTLGKPLSSLARLVLETEDAAARDIVRRHGQILGDYALVAARQVGLDAAPFPLVLTGGVLRHSAIHLAEAIVEQVRKRVPEVRVVRSRLEPVVGALLLALEHGEVEMSEATLARLEASLPPVTLYAT